jgi:hypothetical protein
LEDYLGIQKSQKNHIFDFCYASKIKILKEQPPPPYKILAKKNIFSYSTFSHDGKHKNVKL